VKALAWRAIAALKSGSDWRSRGARYKTSGNAGRAFGNGAGPVIGLILDLLRAPSS